MTETNHAPTEPGPDASEAEWNQHSKSVREWAAASALGYGLTPARPLSFKHVLHPVAYAEVPEACPF